MPSAEARVLRVPNIRRAQREDWQQLIRFCVVGASGYFVNLAVFTTLVHAAGAHYALSAVIAFCVAWTNNFLWNKYWTFRRHGLSAMQQGARYLAVSLVALGLNLAAAGAAHPGREPGGAGPGAGDRGRHADQFPAQPPLVLPVAA